MFIAKTLTPAFSTALVIFGLMGLDDSVGRQDEKAPPKQDSKSSDDKQEKETTKTRRNVHKLTINVTTLHDLGESPVPNARVVVFAGDFRKERTTAWDGTVAFDGIGTNNMTVRVTADRMEPFQKALQCSRNETDHQLKVVLKKSE
jgi:hypothetical protein